MRKMLLPVVAVVLVFCLFHTQVVPASAVTAYFLPSGSDLGVLDDPLGDGSYYSAVSYNFPLSDVGYLKYKAGSSAMTYIPNDRLLHYSGTSRQVLGYFCFVRSPFYDSAGDTYINIESVVNGADYLKLDLSFSVASNNKKADFVAYLYFYDQNLNELSVSSAAASISSYSGTLRLSVLAEVPAGAVFCLPYVTSVCTTTSFSCNLNSLKLTSYTWSPRPPQQPVITEDLQYEDYVFLLNGDSVQLSVDAFAPDGGIISYQWYRAARDGSNPVAIPQATDRSFWIPTYAIGSYRYYCLVTNTLDGAVSSLKSSHVGVTVMELEDPVFTQDVLAVPYSVFLNQELTLSTSAKVSDAFQTAELVYQWYSCSNKYGHNGKPIPGATKDHFTVDTTRSGAFYYYCVVTNTIAGQSATVRSNVAVVYVDYNPEDDKHVVHPILEFSWFVDAGSFVLGHAAGLANLITMPLVDVVSDYAPNFPLSVMGQLVGDRSVWDILIGGGFTLLFAIAVVDLLKS